MKYFIIILLIITCAFSTEADWYTLPDLPTPREQMAVVVLDNIAYFIGGSVAYNDATTASDDVLRFSFETFEWLDPAPSLDLARIGATAVVFDEKIYVIGGRNDDGEYLETIEIWWPGQDFWYHDIGDNEVFTPPREEARAVVLGDTTIAVTGGFQGEEGFLSGVVLVTPDESGLVLNFDTDFDPIPVPRASHGAIVLNDQLCVFGGFYFGPLRDRYVYGEDGWAAIDTLVYPLAGMAVSTITEDSGDVALISGGVKPGGESHNILKMYDNWSITTYLTSLPYGRSNHGMATFSIDGVDYILISGGSYVEEATDTRVLLKETIIWPDPTFYNARSDNKIVIPGEIGINAYPNPSNGEIRLSFSNLDYAGQTEIILYDLLGRKLIDWSGKINDPTGSELTWDGKIAGDIAPAGVYFLAARQGDTRKVIKLLRLP